MDPLVFFPSKNLMCFDGPKNLMCFDGPSTSCDLMDPKGPLKHMSAITLVQTAKLMKLELLLQILTNSNQIFYPNVSGPTKFNWIEYWRIKSKKVIKSL